MTRVPACFCVLLYNDVPTLPSLQSVRYFNQGFRLLAAFDFRRAVISFRAAQDADASCALCVWGEAFALGPNLNSFDEPRLLASVPAAFQKAQQAEKMQSSSQLELGLIRALQARYVRTVEDYVENESELTAGFAAEMEGLLTRFGGARANPNLAALTADALMNMSPWNYWINGHLRPTSLRAKSMLQEALSVSPRHAFCIHLLVHVTEASGNQTLLQEVRPWAEVLPQLMPGAPHLIHMSFHTLMHTGDFHLADGDNTLATELPRQIYPMHNLDTLSWLCRIEGRSLCALDAAKSLEQKALPLIGTGTFETGFPPARFAAVWPLTLVAFGRTKQILSEGLPRQCQQDAFLAGIWHFARGVALVKQLREVRKELEFLREKRIEVEAGLSSPPGMAWKNFHGSKQWAVYPAGRILRLAEEELEARMAELRRVDEQELFRWKEAFRLEADLPYDEPPSWYLPVADRFGEALAARGQVARAWEVFTSSLKKLPRNGWAIHGLWRLCTGQFGAHNATCGQLHEDFVKAWRHADVTLDIQNIPPEEAWAVSVGPWWVLAALAAGLAGVSAWQLRLRTRCASCPLAYHRLDGS